MKKLIFLFLLISGISFSQIQVIHFNANWNAANDVKWVNDLTDCKIKSIDIATNSQAATDHKITVVPTILVLIDGEEEERYEADIAEAKELPVIEIPPPDVTRMEFDMKDKNIRLTIQNTQDDVEEIKEDLKRIEEKIDRLK